MSEQMTELELLRQQKREIEAKIKSLQNRAMQCGSAKISVDHLNYPYREKYSVAVRATHISWNQQRWQTIISGLDRESVINAIPGIVADLQELYESAKAEEGKRA